MPLETTHIGQYRLLSFVPVDRRCVFAVATEIQALVTLTRRLILIMAQVAGEVIRLGFKQRMAAQ